MGGSNSSLVGDSAQTVLDQVKDHHQATDRPIDPRICVLTTKDLDEIATVAGLSFSGTATTDPEGSMDWAVGDLVRGQWDSEVRHEFFRFIMKWSVRTHFGQGGFVYGVRDPESKELMGCIVLRPPGTIGTDGVTEPTSQWISNAMAIGKEGEKIFSSESEQRYGKGLQARLDAIGAEMKNMHTKHAADPHWFLAIAGVHPSHQGCRVGSALLHFLNCVSDQTGYYCYLETKGERNVAVYGKYGWGERVDCPPVVDPSGTVETAFTACVLTRRPEGKVAPWAEPKESRWC